MRTTDRGRLSRLRAASQLLHRPTRVKHPADVVRSIAGAQSQERRAGLLQLRARCRTLTAADVERARVEERSLVRGWLMRGTVHLVATDDYGWMRPLFAPRIEAESRRRLGRLGVDGRAQDRALELIGRLLSGGEPRSRSALAEELARGGLALTPETRVHLMRVAVSGGIACVGPDEAGGGTLVSSDEWLGVDEAGQREHDAALAELARRFIRGFAPAGERDFAKWSGLPIRDCRLGLERIARELVEPAGAGGLLAPRGTSLHAPRSPLVRLLPAFDTYLMGYESRDHAVDAEGERRILPGGGVLRPTVCVDGRLVGLWSSKRSGGRLQVSIDPFEEPPGEWWEAVEGEVADLGRFEGVAAALHALPAASPS